MSSKLFQGKIKYGDINEEYFPNDIIMFIVNI